MQNYNTRLASLKARRTRDMWKMDKQPYFWYLSKSNFKTSMVVTLLIIIKLLYVSTDFDININ